MSWHYVCTLAITIRNVKTPFFPLPSKNHPAITSTLDITKTAGITSLQNENHLSRQTQSHPSHTVPSHILPNTHTRFSGGGLSTGRLAWPAPASHLRQSCEGIRTRRPKTSSARKEWIQERSQGEDNTWTAASALHCPSPDREEDIFTSLVQHH